jgi:hypothetical protein
MAIAYDALAGRVSIEPVEFELHLVQRRARWTRAGDDNEVRQTSIVDELLHQRRLARTIAAFDHYQHFSCSLNRHM